MQLPKGTQPRRNNASIEISCDECRKSFRVNEALAGKRVRCPFCISPIDVPDPEDECEETAPF